MKTTASTLKLSLVLLFISAMYGCDRMTSQQVEWPDVTEETRPWTRWWWHGSAVTEEGITASLEAFRDAGLGGVEITPIYGVYGSEELFLDFLSPEWMDKLVYTLREAERLGLGVDLANASGWPFGGPWVDRDTACRNMQSRTWTLAGGQRIAESVEFIQQSLVRNEGAVKYTINDIKEPLYANGDMQKYAFDQVRYRRSLPLISLTAHKKDGERYRERVDLMGNLVGDRLDWTAPEGEWIVCALFEGDHGKMVERAGPGGEGNVIDHFSAEALKRYLDRFDEAFRGHNIGYLRYFFNDSYEVDDAVGDSDWTPALFEEFYKLNGYDLHDYIPALLGEDEAEINSRVLYDYRATIDQLLLERFTQGWQQWAAAKGKGIRNQAHGSPANIVDLYAASDVPETEGYSIPNLKNASSAAHVKGKKLASSETATWLGEHFESTLGQVKEAVDVMLLSGVNHVFYHGTAYSPQDALWPGWLFYAAVHFTPANSFWEDFGALNGYITRAQGFLQAGRPSNDILVYHSLSDFWSERTGSLIRHYEYRALESPEMNLREFLTDNGYSWDAITDRQILADLKYSGDGLETGGNRYKTIIIPRSDYMPLATLRKLLELADRGATLLFMDRLPSDVPGMAGLGEDGAKLRSLTESLAIELEGRVFSAQRGKGKVIVSNDFATILSAAHITPEGMYAKGLQCIRRLKDDGNYYYFIYNGTEEVFDGWTALNARFRAALIYNPMDGTAGYADTWENDGAYEVYLQLKPQEALIIETSQKNNADSPYPFYKTAAGMEAIALDGKWEISFVKGGPELPASKSVYALGSWTGYGHQYEIFSGTAEYTTAIPELPGEPQAWLLDLGDVHESASVWLGGEYIGTVINPPYSVTIPARMVAAGEKLTVRVSNLMANRIIDMDKRGERWQIFYNTNINSRRPENRDANGDFSAAGWNPKPSGLMGPVTLVPLQPADLK